MDVYSRDQSSSVERLLLDELMHRINNEFAAAIGIVSVATADSTSDEARTALVRVLHRLENLARVHRALQVPDHDTLIDACAYLRQLCEAIVRSQLDYRGIRLTLAEHPVPLRSVRCWTLGMILAKLISNSVRHAFAADATGCEIRIEIKSCGAHIQCRIQDNGSAAGNVKPGRGLKIIGALARRLDGTIDHQFGARGTVCTLTFPI